MRTACEGIRRSRLGARWLPCQSSSAPRRAPVALYIALDDPRVLGARMLRPPGGDVETIPGEHTGNGDRVGAVCVRGSRVWV